MNINKYKKMSTGKYKIEFEDGSEITLYEDVILKFNLLIKKRIDNSEVDAINLLNMEYDVYYVALKAIKNRMRSTFELRELLIKKEYPLEMIDSAIIKLTKQGYLNDENFVKSFINNQIITTSNGPYKIKRELVEKGIDVSLIDNNIVIFDDDEQLSRIEKIVSKKIKSNNSRGGNVLRKKIYSDLIMMGYDNYFINKVLDSVSFEDNNFLAKKEYDKLMRKYSRKYSGYELKRIVSEKLYLKGLKYDEDI